jgi:hypothetical protein
MANLQAEAEAEAAAMEEQEGRPGVRQWSHASVTKSHWSAQLVAWTMLDCLLQAGMMLAIPAVQTTLACKDKYHPPHAPWCIPCYMVSLSRQA